MFEDVDSQGFARGPDRPQGTYGNSLLLGAAVNGQAYGIVTFNLSDFSSPAKQFRIEVMRSGEAMKRLEQKP